MPRINLTDYCHFIDGLTNRLVNIKLRDWLNIGRFQLDLFANTILNQSNRNGAHLAGIHQIAFLAIVTACVQFQTLIAHPDISLK